MNRDPAVLFGFPTTLVVGQTPAFPQGEVDGAPLVSVWQGVTEFALQPGDTVRVSGQVLARQAMTVDSRPALGAETAQWRKQIEVKLRVSAVNGPMRTLIDSDSHIVVGGNVCVEILAPQSWSYLVRPADTESMVEARVYVNACVACCDDREPNGQLTFFRTPSAAEVRANMGWLTPKGAVGMRYTEWGAGPDHLEFFDGDYNGGVATQLGRVPIATADDRRLELFGAVGSVLWQPNSTSNRPVMTVWEIAG